MMTHVYETKGGWNIEIEYSYHKGTTPAGGDDPESLVIHEISGPFTLIAETEQHARWLCKAFMIDFEDIENEILDENR